MEWLTAIVLVFIGVAGGIAVGGGMVAFLVVLDIIPRLAQLTRSFGLIRHYETAVVLGSLYWTLADFFNWQLMFAPMSSAFVGVLSGCFVGMLAAALTEVINVLPILAKRIGLDSVMIWLLMAMIFGKVVGSLLEWLQIIG